MRIIFFNLLKKKSILQIINIIIFKIWEFPSHYFPDRPCVFVILWIWNEYDYFYVKYFFINYSITNISRYSNDYNNAYCNFFKLFYTLNEIQNVRRYKIWDFEETKTNGSTERFWGPAYLLLHPITFVAFLFYLSFVGPKYLSLPVEPAGGHFFSMHVDENKWWWTQEKSNFI